MINKELMKKIVKSEILLKEDIEEILKYKVAERDLKVEEKEKMCEYTIVMNSLMFNLFATHKIIEEKEVAFLEPQKANLVTESIGINSLGFLLDRYENEKMLNDVAYLSIGYAEECGEYCGKIKKILRDDNGLASEEKRIELLKELGDGLFYNIANIRALGSTIEEVVSILIKKLESRRDRGVLSGSGDNR